MLLKEAAAFALADIDAVSDFLQSQRFIVMSLYKGKYPLQPV